MSPDARSNEELLQEIEMLRKRVSELENLRPGPESNLTSDETFKEVRVLDRKPLFIEVPIVVVGDPHNLGTVLNMTVKGLGVRGIRCTAQETLKLEVCPPEDLSLQSFSFVAVCRWTHEEQSDGMLYSGFEIIDISSQEMSHLRGLLMALGYEYLRDQFRRKIGEEALKFIEASSDLICRMTQKGVISFVNNAFCRFAGLSRSSLQGLDLEIFVPESSRDHLKAFLSAHRSEDYHGSFEFPLVGASGECRLYHWTIDARGDSDALSLEFQLVGRDITEPRMNEQKLRESHSELEREIRDRTSELELLNTELRQEIKRRKRIEEALDRKLWALTKPNVDMGDLELTDLIDVAALQKFQDFFCDVWGIQVELINIAGQMITTPVSLPDPYRTLISTVPGRRLIEVKNAEIVSKMGLEPVQIHKNYLLADDSIFLIPIIIQERNMGAWKIWKGSDPKTAQQEVAQLALETGTDANLLLDSIASTPAIDEDELLKACNLLSLISAQVSALGLQNLFQARMINELNVAQAEIRRSEQKLRNLLESAPVGIFLMNSGAVSFANKALSQMYGVSSPLEMEGLKPGSFFRNGQFDEKVLESGNSGELIEKEYVDLQAVRKDGSVLDVDFYCSKMHSGSDATIIGFVIDKSQEKALQNQLLHSQKMEALGTFAGGIAHDFNNVLTIIMGFAEIALMDIGRNHVISAQLEQIIEAAKRARDLVHQILTFCRKAEQQKRPLNVVPIIKETLKFLEASFPATIKIQGKILANDRLIMGDPSQFHQILMNLFSNAGYAMRNEGGVLEVVLEVVNSGTLESEGIDVPAPGEYLKLTVKDSGPGVEPEIRARIFEPYFTTKPSGEGSGLGLAVVHGIVTSHGGVIRLDQSCIHGARFEVYLPVVEPVETTDENEFEEDFYGNQRIMVVDDEKVVTEIAREMLENFGYKVFTFSNPIVALNIFRVGPYDFDLLITDLTMNEMTGLSLAQEVKKIRPDISVLLITGYDTTDETSTNESGVIDGMVQKPFTNKTLGRAVKRTLLRNSAHILDRLKLT